MNEELRQIGIVALACGLGAIIGIEREFADKPAGLRTHVLVCGASALLMLLGDSVVDRFEAESSSTISADPIRIIQAIVVGISFLGAGTIIHHADNRVEGLTTAASILLTSGIGLATALGQYTLAVGISLMTLTILIFVGALERRIPGRKEKEIVSADPARLRTVAEGSTDETDHNDETTSLRSEDVIGGSGRNPSSIASKL